MSRARARRESQRMFTRDPRLELSCEPPGFRSQAAVLLSAAKVLPALPIREVSRYATRARTRAIRFEPTELLEKLAAMIPKPRINLLVYHGVFAPHARHRPEAVLRAQESARRHSISPGAGRPETLLTAATANGGVAHDSPTAPRTSPPATAPGAGADSQPGATARPPPRAGYQRPKHYAWADLLQRIFAIDVLACPDCGGRLRLLATIEDRAVIERILRHLDLPASAPTAAPARAAGWLPGVDAPAAWVTE